MLADIEALNPEAAVVRAESPVELGDPLMFAGKTVLVVDDGSTITHGEMAFGRVHAVAARYAGASDHRPAAVGRRIDRRGLRAIPAHRARPARDGATRRAAAGARGDDQRDSVRCRRDGG